MQSTSDPSLQSYYERMRKMTQETQRVLTIPQRDYMRNHPLENKSAADLVRHAESLNVKVAHLSHRYDILQAIDNHKNGTKK